jgi:hypothetical protein
MYVPTHAHTNHALPPTLPHTINTHTLSYSTIIFYTDTRKSALWFAVYTALLLSWTLTYLIGGASVLGTKTYKDLDIMNVDLASAGIGG